MNLKLSFLSEIILQNEDNLRLFRNNYRERKFFNFFMSSNEQYILRQISSQAKLKYSIFDLKYLARDVEIIKGNHRTLRSASERSFLELLRDRYDRFNKRYLLELVYLNDFEIEELLEVFLGE